MSLDPQLQTFPSRHGRNVVNRKDKIAKLKSVAPTLVAVTKTEDMGFEFAAVVPDGVIYPEPGMLIDYSNGAWPPDEWDQGNDEQIKILMREFLLNPRWAVTAWAEISGAELDQWLAHIDCL